MAHDANPPAPPPPARPGSSARKGPPAWGIALFLVLLGGVVVVNQVISTGGTPIRWIDDDLAAAMKQADQKNQRVFLYLYEPNDPTHVRNEREVFAQRWARTPLENAVSCRMALPIGDVRRVQFRYDGKPLFLLLNAKSKEMARTEGAVSELEFLTYIGRPAEDHAAQKRASP
jgi:hypothetical protein